MKRAYGESFDASEDSHKKPNLQGKFFELLYSILFHFIFSCYIRIRIRIRMIEICLI